MALGLGGAIGGAVAASLGSSNDDENELARKVCDFVCQILPNLDKKLISKRETKLCEAFCLLWHHLRLGTVAGRQNSDKLISCCYVGVMLDLWAVGKIEITVQKSSKNYGSAHALVKVIDATRTHSVLDAAGFNAILKLHEDEKRELTEWISKCVECHPDDNCASVILDSFVEKGIIAKEEKWFGLKKIYPTKDKEPQLQLVLEIRGITLRDVAPDGFMSVLLPLLHFADNLHIVEDPLLRRHFDEAEYEKARPRLNEILRKSGYLELPK